MFNPLTWIDVNISNLKDKYLLYKQYCIEANNRVREISKFFFWYCWIEAIITCLKTIFPFWFMGGFFGYVVPSLNHFNTLSSYDKSKWYIVLCVFGSLLAYLSINIFDAFLEKIEKTVAYAIASRIIKEFLIKLSELDYGKRQQDECDKVIEIYQDRKASIVLNVFNEQTVLLGCVVGIVVAIVVLFREQGYFVPVIVVLGIAYYITISFINKKWPCEEKSGSDVSAKLLQHEESLYDSRCWHSLNGRSQDRYILKETLDKVDSLIEIENYNASQKRRSYLINVSVQTFFFALGLGILCYLLWDENLNFATIGLIMGSFQAFARSASSSIYGWVSLEESLVEFGKFKDFLSWKPVIDESECVSVDFIDTPPIRLKKVSFSYAKATGDKSKKKKRVINRIDYAFKPGLNALIGVNGCGKTTLFHLLKKDLLPDKGKIFYGHMLLAKITRDSLLEQGVFMPSTTFFAELPLDQAIAGCDRDQIDGTRLVNAVRLADLEKFIWEKASEIEDINLQDKPLLAYEIMPDNNWWDETSTGQYQRLVLASVFYRMLDPKVKIILLDEPVANCDPRLKEMFYSSLQNFKDKLVIIILHDAKYLTSFDTVVVMNEGKILHDLQTPEEIASHIDNIAELMTQDDESKEDENTTDGDEAD